MGSPRKFGNPGGAPSVAGGGMVAYATKMGGAGWTGQVFGDGIIGGIHCGARAIGSGAHITLFANTCLLV